ncbi:PD40 domain-containing protein [Paenibacillus sp. HW567]|uniref:PD40 domain-containing protein n=1 Tax=Paenibacillus sp. HW567 TaxID=1034769 RepID=UPI00036A77EC|nr:PD40 domain-containing protein [Paenibacillus sp. HW567]
MNITMSGRAGKVALILMGTAMLLGVTACSTGNTETRQVVEKGGQKITVLDNTSESVYTKLKLAGIDKVEGVRGLDFASEDTIVVDKENRSLPPQTIEGQERYPHNLYLRTLSSGNDTPLQEGDKNYGAAQFSPDKKQLFYRELYDATGIGYLMNLAAGTSVKVSDAEFRNEEGIWTDNEHVIFPDMEGNIISAGINGSQDTMLKTGIPYVHEVSRSGSRLLYVTGEDSQLTAYDTDTKQSKALRKNVIWAVPSPDGSRLAIVERKGPGEMVLLLCDSEGNEQSRVASGQQIYGTSWSPDGSKLAYVTTAASAADNQDGLFITEVETGEQTPVLNDIEVADQLRWSPSGKKLLASISVLKDNAYQFITYIVRLS